MHSDELIAFNVASTHDCEAQAVGYKRTATGPVYRYRDGSVTATSADGELQAYRSWADYQACVYAQLSRRADGV